MYVVNKHLNVYSSDPSSCILQCSVVPFFSHKVVKIICHNEISGYVFAIHSWHRKKCKWGSIDCDRKRPIFVNEFKGHCFYIYLQYGYMNCNKKKEMFLFVSQGANDPFGSEPFSTGGGPPPRPESPTPALPPKKSKQPPPRPAPPKTRPAKPPPPQINSNNNPTNNPNTKMNTNTNSDTGPNDPFVGGWGDNKTASAANNGGFADFANFADFDTKVSFKLLQKFMYYSLNAICFASINAHTYLHTCT